MAEFKLGRIRFVWKGEWSSSTTYYVDDVVKNGGQVYICSVGHTSDSDFYNDLNAGTPRWQLMSSGQDWKDDWQTDTYYKENDLVKYGGTIYVCNNPHTSAATESLGLENDVAKWDVFSEGFDWKGAWTTSTRYKLNDLVKYGGYTYVCNTGHTSSASAGTGLEGDQAKWDAFNQGLEYKGDWAPSTRYKLNDLVKFGAGTWIATNPHTASADFVTDVANWSQFAEGLEFGNTWSSITQYQPGDVVGYGGNQYVALTVNTNNIPSTSSANWSLFSKGFDLQGDWSISTTYRPGHVVRHGGNSYLAAIDSPSITTTATATASSSNRVTVADSTGLVAGMALRFSGISFGNLNIGATYYVKTVETSTAITLSETPGGATRVLTNATGTMTITAAASTDNNTYWQRLLNGFYWKGGWTDDTEYAVGDVVRYGTNSYVCVLSHRSEEDDGSTVVAEGGGSDNSRPDQDVTGTYWNVLTIGNEVSTLTTTGDLVYYGGAGPTRLPIGTQGQVLAVGSAGTPEWQYLWATDHEYYVGTNGTDGAYPIYGSTLQSPWKTIRYACEQVEKGPRNPNAQYLLERNRIFIQKEVSAWIRAQIDGSILPFSGSFDYDEYKCERDVGFVLDRLIWDIGHGGNLKIRAAAQSFVGALGEGPYSAEEEDRPYVTLAGEKEEGIAAYNYMLEVIESVLDNQAPTVAYQNVSDDSTAIAEQYFNADLETEPGVMSNITSLVGIITTALNDEDSSNIPERISPQNLIRVAVGTYSESLPIIVPAYTCILGSELRSTAVQPAGSLIDSSDAFFSIPTLDHLSTVVANVVKGTAVTPTSGNSESQITGYPTADVPEADAVTQLMQVMKHQADFKTRSLASAYLTDPTGYNSAYLIGYGDARKLIKENKKFFQEEIIAWLADNYPTSKYQKTLTRRDTGYIVDAIVYDLTYGGNALSVHTGLAYYDGDDDTEPQISDSIKALTLDAVGYLKSIMQLAAQNSVIPALQSDITQFRDTAGSAGAVTFIGSNIDDIIELIDTGPAAVGTTVTLSDPATTDGVSSTTALINAYSTLNAAASTIRSNTISWIDANYPSLTYDSTKCSRDIGIILKAVGYDFMLNTNYQTLKAGYAYLRPTASEVYTLNQKTVTRSAIEYALTLALANVGGDSTAQTRISASSTVIDNVIYGATNEGEVCQTELRNRDYAILKLEENRNFIKAETTAYIADTFSDTATDTTNPTNVITISDTSWLVRNAAIQFTGTVFGGIVANTTYYVQNIVSSTTFTIATTRYATSALTLSTASGSMNVAFVYDSTFCLRDVDLYIDALKWDLRYTSNYQSRYVARYYANGVLGSYEEDMYYLRDATGVRDQTLQGLNGDLTPENAYGTSRVTAGAYCSLDPGWGPADFRTWIISRSPYVQGVTTLGNGAIGQKIDGALHDGGNDSMVSNDFTQVISDGIGAYITNNGRAELVSVFTYYSYIGYLAENGGRVRATNGNNSYGEFGAVAEGFDASETADTAIVDNKFQFRAVVGSVFTDLTDDVLAFEFDHAGNEYTDVEWLVSGAGTGVSTEADEFRDDAVFQVRLLDNVDDSATAPEADGNYGGFGYVTATGTAQAGTSTQITLSVTDSQPNGAYVGMKVYITGGTGVGQFGLVASYNAGSKVATVTKPSTGGNGWDHVVSGTSIVAPDASSTYVVEPAISFTAPGFDAVEKVLPSSGTWNDAVYGDTAAVYTPVSGTYSGSGASGATWTVIRNGTKYTVSQVGAGTGYTRLETITVAGNLLGGTTPTNDLTITITAVNSVTGAIQAFETTGYGAGGRFVAVKGTSTNAGAYSDDGISWFAMTLPSSGTWSGVAHGIFDDGSSVGKISRFVAIRTGSNAAAYSADGINWVATTMPSSTTWNSVTFGNGRFVAVNSTNGETAVSLDGEVWDISGSSSGAWTDVTYGKGYFVAVRTATTVSAYSLDGISWSDSSGGLPAGSAWTSVTWGNGKFVAVASDSNSGAYSLDGTSWTAMSIGSPDSSDPAGYQQVAYGQGLFMTTAYIAGESGEGYSYVMTSEDGLTWSDHGLPESASPGGGGYNAVAFGNPNRSGRWVAITKASGTHVVSIRTGARAKARAFVAEEKIFAIRMTEPGSGYDSAPTITITDPNNTFEAPTQVRIGVGALATPSFVNRGTGMVSADAEVDRGDGYADFYQSGRFMAVRRLTARPAVGSNIVFGHLPDQTFKLVSVVSFLGSYDGSYSCFFQISPEMKIFSSPDHATSVSTRIRYSQVRMTGHDFLDIGTGNFTKTNYPNTPTQVPVPANEIVEANGGRVFFTSTDQDGNFRVGGLFNVEQATGIATLNADAFNIAGLQELSLGEVTLGGASATITEFSTDPFFTLDSDSVVPTQRAIKAYISSQIGGGGASLNVNSVTAGSIFISTNEISTIGGEVININANFNFTKPVTGLPLAFNYFIL